MLGEALTALKAGSVGCCLEIIDQMIPSSYSGTRKKHKQDQNLSHNSPGPRKKKEVEPEENCYT